MSDPIQPALVPDRLPRWYQGLDRYCWVVFAVAGLGWLFDTMDQNIFNLIRAPSMRDLLASHGYRGAELTRAVSDKGGIVTSVFLIGWSVGGFLFGMIGDRLGRTKTIITTILVYAIFTGASGLVHSWQTYAVARFFTALGVGGEWAAGAALVAEVFPNRSRAMALGSLQSLSAFGNMLAACITLALGDLDARWRWAYFIGAAPALLVIWISSSVKEPARWQAARDEAKLGKELGSIGELFTHPVLRRRTIAAILMATAGVGALWGVAYYSPEVLRSELKNVYPTDPKRIGRYVSIVFLVQQAGAAVGIYLFAVLAERTSRKTAFYFWFALAWGSVLAFFWGMQGAGGAAFGRAMFLAPLMGFCTLGPFSGYTLYFPELFPTRLRASGCGVCYNAARVLAAAAPAAQGKLVAALGGFAPAATVVAFIYVLGFVGTWLGPETGGRPLPEDADLVADPRSPVAA